MPAERDGVQRHETDSENDNACQRTSVRTVGVKEQGESGTVHILPSGTYRHHRSDVTSPRGSPDRRHESPMVVMTQRAASTHGPDREEPDVAL